MRLPGFEPGSEAWEASVLTAGLQSQRRGIMFLIFHSWFRFLPFSIPFDRRRVISPTERSIPRRHVFYSISLLDVPSDSWSRGYDVALTRRRSPVQFRPGPPYLLFSHHPHRYFIDIFRNEWYKYGDGIVGLYIQGLDGGDVINAIPPIISSSGPFPLFYWHRFHHRIVTNGR